MEVMRSVVEITNRQNLEGCPKDMSELLDSHFLELKNEDGLETGVGRAVEQLTASALPPPIFTTLGLRRYIRHRVSAKHFSDM